MTDIAQPIRMRAAILITATTKAAGTLVLYPDRMAHVKSRIAGISAGLGCAVIAVLSYALAHAGPGAVGAAIGAGGGQAIGNAIARGQAPKKAAAGGADITTISLDSITSVGEHKAGRLKGWRLAISTSDGTQHTFRVKPGQWPSEIADALAARGRDVQATSAGIAVLSQS